MSPSALPVQLLAAHHYNLPEHMFAYLSCDRCATPEVCAFTQDCPRLARPAPPSVARTGSPHHRPIPLAVPGVFTGMCARAGEPDNFARDNAKARTLSSSRGAASAGCPPARDEERAP